MGKSPLRIAANLRPTQLAKRMVPNFKQEVAAAETPLVHTLWACKTTTSRHIGRHLAVLGAGQNDGRQGDQQCTHSLKQ